MSACMATARFWRAVRVTTCWRCLTMLWTQAIRWPGGGDVSGDFTRTGLAMLPDSIQPTQQLRQEHWDDWRMTYDHVMVIYGKAIDEQGKPYYLVKNSWGKYGQYDGIWYMSRDYIMLNTTYLFLNRQALPKAILTNN